MPDSYDVSVHEACVLYLLAFATWGLRCCPISVKTSERLISARTLCAQFPRSKNVPRIEIAFHASPLFVGRGQCCGRNSSFD